ncbi:MAG: integrase core domain-containing protein [Dermatophilaceae bacterium]
MRAGLAAVGYRLSGKRVWRLMKAAGLPGRHPKAWRRTTIGGADPVPAPDLLGRSFFAEQPNQKWCGDVTYIKTWDGWAYLGHRDRPALTQTHRVGHRRPHAHELGHRRPGHGHRKPPATSRGYLPLRPWRPICAQYTSREFAKYCKEHHVRRSLGRTGICYDNAVSESFFATYKKELIHTRPWPTITDLKEKTKDWVDNYYNVKRRHSYLEYLTPTEFELGFRHLNQLAA